MRAEYKHDQAKYAAPPGELSHDSKLSSHDNWGYSLVVYGDEKMDSGFRRNDNSFTVIRNDR